MELSRVIHVSSIQSKFTGPARWLSIIEHLESIILKYPDIDFAVLEGYAFGSFELSTLGEIMGLIKYQLFMSEIPYGDVPPNTLKKFFTGHGHAKKSEMMAKAEELGYEIKNDNEADAIALAHYGTANGFDGLRNNWPAPPKPLSKKKSK